MHDTIENLVSQIRLLPFEERLLLIQRVAEELRNSASSATEDSTGGAPASAPDSRLIFGKYRNAADRMSSEEDFVSAEWQPDDKVMNGE
ncbi:MAG: hypothetical protein KF868_17075 [Acidobacteria bacterium]|nr:hypothetical protein [Acidobacteriota bacterium]MCW5968625.1 hypothetical protein [Blastocatellales bacterium]